MTSMTVEMVLSLIDRLSAPLKSAEDGVRSFWKGARKEAEDAAGGADAYLKKIEGLKDNLAKLGMIQLGASQLKSNMDALAAPVDDMISRAREFEKVTESIARGAGRLDLRAKIGGDILDASRAGNVPWQDIAKGEAHLVSLGGGEFLDKVAPIRQRMAKLPDLPAAAPKRLATVDLWA